MQESFGKLANLVDGGFEAEWHWPLTVQMLYLAFPALGNAGSKREWVLCALVPVYMLLAMWASIDTLLPS
jgi:hypothetical protein